MNIIVFSGVNKKSNSTYQPTGGTAISCVLKAPTDVNNPTFEVSLSNYGNAASINYVVWGANYYFVTENTYETNDIISVNCKLDVLATYKGAIQSSTQFVERSSSNYNLYINDPLNMPTDQHATQRTALSFTGLTMDGSGCYILITVGTSGTTGAVGSGFTNSYALTNSQMYQLAFELFTPTVVDEIRKEFTSPMEAIVSCHWIPFSINNISGSSLPVSLGSYMTSVNGKLISSRLLNGSFTFINTNLFPNNVLYDFSGENYLQCSPYSSGIMFLPFVGCVPYDVDYYFKGGQTVNCYVDILTGDVLYSFGTRSATYTGNCASKCPIASSQTNLLGFVNAIMQFTASAGSALITGGINPASSAIASANYVANTPNTIGAMVNSLGVHTQINGAMSTGMSVFPIGEGNIPAIYIDVRIPAYSPTSIVNLYGGMLNQVVSLSGMSGYVKCNGACISTIADYQEKKEIENYMNNGFYIE